MCGITGVISRGNTSRNHLKHAVNLMNNAILHRGPDDSGIWVEPTAKVALGHRRLSILDLSLNGHQPMTSHCGRYILVFNGEIYNHLEIREALGNRPWRGHSDTETILALMTKMGPIQALEQLVGMFAMASWDRETRTLTLARDRMGEKPLYYGRLESGDFVFGSELHALRAHPHFDASIDRNALALYMRHSVFPGETCIYKSIHKLLPGSWMRIDDKGKATHGRYWDLREKALSLTQNQVAMDNETALAELERLMTQSVRGQMISDVPLGAFLSGGVDSSTVVALMCQQSGAQVRTFSIGFNEPGYNEAEHAKAVATHLGTRHTELYVSSDDALSLIPSLTQIYDEPFADSSQIPTYLVSKLARQDVSVVLSGDGGDELFTGYNRYLIAERAWGGIARVPLSVRKVLAWGLLAIPPSWTDAAVTPFQKAFQSAGRHSNIGSKLQKFAHNVLPAQNTLDMYHSLVSHWKDPTMVVEGAECPRTLIDETDFDHVLSAVEQMSLVDQLTYLPDDILTKVDRASMALGLETRTPMLDHRIVEFSWKLAAQQKYNSGRGKWLLRELLYKHVPKSLIERPKQGFAIPLERWLRGPLRPWADDLLSPEALKSAGYLDVSQIRTKWEEHLSGRRNWQTQLWSALMFQAWYFGVHRAQSSPFLKT